MRNRNGKPALDQLLHSGVAVKTLTQSGRGSVNSALSNLKTRKFRICKYLYRDADPRKGSVTSEEKLRLMRCRVMRGYAGKCLRIRARHRTAALALDNACSSLRS